MILPFRKKNMMQYDRIKRSLIIVSLIIGVYSMLNVNGVKAQDIQSTPLSRFGYGTMQNSAPVSWRGMGGVGVGMNDKRVINFLNPAGYGATDSLSFLIDVGASVNMGHYRDGVNKKTTFLGGVDYIAVQMPLYKNRLALSAGLVPMSNVGYGLTTEVDLEGEDGFSKFQQRYTGKGSLQSVYLGLGGRLWDNLYLGVNGRYMFGSVTNIVHLIPNTNSLAQTYTENSLRLRDWSFDLGAQYKFKMKNKRQDEVIIGLTYTPKLPIKPELFYFENRNFGSQNKPEITDKNITADASLPHKIAAGLSWNIPNKMTLALDYGVELWSGVDNIFVNDGVKMLDRHHAALGMELLPDLYSRKYYEKMSYRFGINYSSSYLDRPVVGGLHTVGASIGIGMPVNMVVSDRLSMINLTLEYNKDISPLSKNFSQDVLKLSLGISFNETWFRKLKIY